MSGRWLGASVALLAMVAFVPARADACSVIAPPTALLGLPADGATGVATNVRPIYDAQRADLMDPASQNANFEIVSASGEVISAQAKSTHYWHFELFPAAELQPLTAYTIRGSWTRSLDLQSVTFTVSFTTGPGRQDARPAPPAATMRHYRLDHGPGDSCSPPSVGTCVSLPVAGLVQANFVDNVGQEHTRYDNDGTPTGAYIYGGPFFTNLSGIDQGTPFVCVRLRSRGTDGSLSDPVDVCGKDAPLYDLTGSDVIRCTEAGLTHDGRLVTASEPTSGCNVAGHAPTSALALVLLAAALCRQRSTRSRYFSK